MRLSKQGSTIANLSSIKHVMLYIIQPFSCVGLRLYLVCLVYWKFGKKTVPPCTVRKVVQRRFRIKTVQVAVNYVDIVKICVANPVKSYQ